MASKASSKDIKTVEEKLQALYDLQEIDSKIDKIRTIRGELPLEVQDLEDEIAGLETRISKYNDEISTLEADVSGKKNAMVASKEAIKKYTEQQNNVRNNREYDSLTKEIEFQNLEIQLAEKRIKEYKSKIDDKKVIFDEAKVTLESRIKELEHKKSELDEIISETQKEESELDALSEKAKGKIDERLLTAYTRIRDNARNGLAVVPVERDSCGGCFNQIPPQRQMDIKLHKKIIVCEHCGRVLVDASMAGIEEVVEEVKPKRRAKATK
tara:strand:+ start:761 stop:1567 length:807 start_codon:yes stop_codon:yes gene_type:complete